MRHEQHRATNVANAAIHFARCIRKHAVSDEALRELERLGYGHDANLRAFVVNQAHLRHANVMIEAMFFLLQGTTSCFRLPAYFT